MIRKAGGFSFQELNLTVDDIAAMSKGGADLSYDFITRPAYHHALLTGDTEFLRMMLREMVSASMAWYRALRTRRSFNGFLPLTLEPGSSSRN